MGICTSTHSSDRKGMTEMIPPWIHTVQVKPEFAGDKFSAFSDGLQLVSANTVVRHRPGRFDTDAARWSRGFTSGKHVFEIVYPMNQRGTEAAVGVGLAEAPLHEDGRVTLVGHNKLSWGIDLRTKRAFHDNQVMKKYPSTQIMLPDRFYMYLDADSRALQFGSDAEFYGTAFHGMDTNGEALYPMIATVTQGSTLTMIYRGVADMSGPEQQAPPQKEWVDPPQEEYVDPPQEYTEPQVYQE